MGPRQPPTLPTDLLLEIILRSGDDTATFVRCAMISKTLLHAMLSFLGDRAKANGGFDPSLLMAVSYRHRRWRIDSNGGEGTVSRRRHGCTNSIVVVEPPGALCRFVGGTDLLVAASAAADPTSSRDGLVVLFKNKRAATDGILVANTITGRVTSLPSMGPQRGTSTAGMFRPALLSVDGAGGRSFELLVMYRHDDDRSLVTQTFSSPENEWGAARTVIHSTHIHRLREAASTAPAVVGRSVHWLCYTQQLIQEEQRLDRFEDRDLAILALHAESAQATVIRLPQELLTRIGRSVQQNNPVSSLILAATTTASSRAQGEEESSRQLSLVVEEALVISTWTLLVADDGSSWSRQVVIRRREIDRPLAYPLDAYQPIWFSTFGERSGTVLFWMWRIGLVQLNLGTRKTLVLCRRRDDEPRNNITQTLLHEINLESVLRCMKSV